MLLKKKKKHRDGLSMACGIKKENQESSFQRLRVARGEGEANEFVLAENEKTKINSVARRCFARVSSVVCRSRSTERRSKRSVNKNDSNTNFPERQDNGRGKRGWLEEWERGDDTVRDRRRIKYSNKISTEHSRGGMSVCI